MGLSWEAIVGLCLLGGLIGGFVGGIFGGVSDRGFKFPKTERYADGKIKPLTHDEFRNLSVGTEVLYVQYGWRGTNDVYLGRGVICEKPDGNKLIDTGNGNVEFTEVDAWTA